MNALTLFAVACLAVVSHALPSDRIVGGHDAPIGKYPHMVALRVGGQFICGGSIMNRRYILTAAHCIVNAKPEDLTVHVGTYSVNETGVVHTVQKLIPHSKYNAITFDNDIGLIRLNEIIRFEYRKIYPIVLTDSGKVYKTGDPAFLAGWGRLSASGSLPVHLQEIELALVSLEACQVYHPDAKYNHVCTFTKQGEGACYGDSGSGLVDKDGLLIGIVSYGTPCAVGRPDVFTRVLSHRYWIVSQLEYPS